MLKRPVETKSTRMLTGLGLLLLCLCLPAFAASELHTAVEQGDFEAVQTLAKKKKINRRDEKGNTALHLAAWKGDRAIIDLLLRAGASLSKRDAGRMRPLHCAIAAGHSEIARYFIAQGAHVDEWSDMGTPLLLAALVGDVETTKILLARGASIAARTNTGATIVHVAAERGHADIIRLLLEAGAEPDLWTYDRTRPIHMASGNGHTEAASVLLEAGVNVNARDGRNYTSLHYAAVKGDADVARWLIAQDASLSPKDRDGDTPLHVSAIGGHMEVARVLLEAGADPHAKNQYGYTPAMVAKRMKHSRIEELLSNAE